jgi:rhodanese-related sulfurtransferase
MSEDYTPQQVAGLLAGGGVQVIDVRTAAEREAGHIAGTRWIELSDLPAQASTIDQNVPVIFYCRAGSRSAMATEALLHAGFDAHNMTGGMLEWVASGLELEPADGYVADH